MDRGLTDLRKGRVTLESLLVSIGAPRLQSLGLDLPVALEDAEHRLYALLADEDPDAAHGRYNALVRGLVSFERSLGCAGS